MAESWSDANVSDESWTGIIPSALRLSFSQTKIAWNNWSCFEQTQCADDGLPDQIIIRVKLWFSSAQALSISTLFASSMQLNGNNGNDFNVLSDRLGSFCILCRLIFVFDTAVQPMRPQMPGRRLQHIFIFLSSISNAMFWNFIENHNFNEMNIPGKTWHFSSFFVLHYRVVWFVRFLFLVVGFLTNLVSDWLAATQQ